MKSQKMRILVGFFALVVLAMSYSATSMIQVSSSDVGARAVAIGGGGHTCCSYGVDCGELKCCGAQVNELPCSEQDRGYCRASCSLSGDVDVIAH